MSEQVARSREDRLAVDVAAASVGQRIREARQQRGMSLAQLGGDQLSRSFLSLVEHGRSRISLKALMIVAERLDLPLSYFLEGSPGGTDSALELVFDEVETALHRQDPTRALHLLDTETISEQFRGRELWLRGWALMDSGEIREALPVLRRGLDVATERGDERLMALITYKVGGALYTIGTYDEALAYFRRALEWATQEPEDPVFAGKVTVSIGHALYMQGQFDDAIAHYERATELFGAVYDFDAQGCLYSGLSLAYRRRGDIATALRYSRLSVATFEAADNIRQAAGELNNMAMRYLELNDLDQALQHAREAVEHAQRVDACDMEVAARATLAQIYLRRDDVDQAEREAQLAAHLDENEQSLFHISAIKVLAELAGRRGDDASADELYKRALQGLQDTGQRGAFSDAALAYSRLLRSRGDIEGALEYATQAAQTVTGQQR